MSEDPFAAAQVSDAAPVNGVSLDESPFATEDDVKSGGGTPAPKVDALAGQLVVMIPREFTSDAPVHEDFRKSANEVQDRYTVDLWVIGQGDFTYPYQVEKDGIKIRETATIELPAVAIHVWVFQRALIGQLRRIDGSSRPMLAGRMRRGPVAKARAAGATFDTVEAAWSAWDEAFRDRKATASDEPSYSWQIDVALTGEDSQALNTWWSRNKSGILPINKATVTTGQRQS